MLALDLPEQAPRILHFGRYDTLPLPLSRILLVGQDLAAKVTTLEGTERLPDDYEPHLYDVLRRVDGNLLPRRGVHGGRQGGRAARGRSAARALRPARPAPEGVRGPGVEAAVKPGVRVTGGAHRGRGLAVPPGARPTEGRVREALFSIWSDRLEGARVLDLFAGSGVVGLEAVGRGALSALLIDEDLRAVKTLEANLRPRGREDRRDPPPDPPRRPRPAHRRPDPSISSTPIHPTTSSPTKRCSPEPRRSSPRTARWSWSTPPAATCRCRRGSWSGSIRGSMGRAR